jgi:signal transduction histidine kinase
MLAPAPPEEIAWLAQHGRLRQLEVGGVLTSKDGPVEGMHIVLNGHLTIYVDRGAGRRKVMEWYGGDITGLLPYSRLVTPPADVVAEEPTDLVTVHRNDLPEMIRHCHEVTAICVHAMVDRARHFTSSFLHDEKLVSLGKLAAGLAHELNNPASAIARSARALSGSVTESEAAARVLASIGVTEAQMRAADQVREAGVGDGLHQTLSPLELEDREDSITAWLTKHRLEPSAAEALADAGVTLDQLDQLSASTTGPALNAMIRWIATACSTRRLTTEIQVAASRIHDLVGAIKGFTEMDRATVPEAVDIARGVSNTIVVLKAKAKSKRADLRVEIPQDLPHVNGFASELNQIWANLLDNALDAIPDEGRVQLTAVRESDVVVVRVVDNGPGIPPNIQDRIFDPFFTTKPVGQGTGLGLDIVRRLVQRHNGTIELKSGPGQTEFRVTLPVAPALKERA